MAEEKVFIVDTRESIVRVSGTVQSGEGRKETEHGQQTELDNEGARDDREREERGTGERTREQKQRSNRVCGGMVGYTGKRSWGKGSSKALGLEKFRVGSVVRRAEGSHRY